MEWGPLADRWSRCRLTVTFSSRLTLFGTTSLESPLPTSRLVGGLRCLRLLSGRSAPCWDPLPARRHSRSRPVSPAATSSLLPFSLTSAPPPSLRSRLALRQRRTRLGLSTQVAREIVR